ncbi:type I-C CRISPR-associated protein Cas8c/Csd1 [Paenibacillus apiarius]|uniref:type I-C CRISPR-associated protein Cas8c/Csd1 n=1 Tax=Paenibacillus apiarius TaxID=46240 RepID=UPI00197E5893|nr:type I-C CRISPR-associated protein Cas8c/Csd1 [Paenibacillus apiarius]MBN3525827.1 type I-C CRISPR-associated protein Cas8c/Csd1 [Paenibacillus apiarius]
MSWLQQLYETYESNLDRVGVVEKRHNGQEFTLLPISHTTQTAHIEVRVTEDGEFHSAIVVDKSDASTLIPCTEDSSSRSGTAVFPYPLHDKLSYVAGDYIDYGGQAKKADQFKAYIEKLEEWALSPFRHPHVASIFKYLNKKRLVRDLVEKENLLSLDGNGCLLGKWDKKYGDEKPPLFGVLNGEQESAFIRFTVYSPVRPLKEVWKDPEVYDSFIRYYNSKLGNNKLCYVTGQLVPGTDKHANKIRNPADKAKLISASDTSGFTFRGRFSSSQEAAGISYEVSQKAHNALKWLINRQGKIIDGRVFLIWSNDAVDVPAPGEDTFALFPEQSAAHKRESFTNEGLARDIVSALAGYGTEQKLSLTNPAVNLLILDSATTGRMAVLYYRNLDKKHYFEKLVEWHSTCVWLHRYRKDEQGDYVQFFGTPATKDIAYAAYGSTASDKVVKGLMERMLPCMLDGVKIPADIVSSVVRRASNPVAMEKWEWEKTLSIACALVNKFYQKEGYKVALDKENDDRSYLFGRLLAVADILERRALGSEETRATNAIRYMNSFAQHPERTWRVIQAGLHPYQARLGAKCTDLTKLMDEILSKFKYEDFNDKPLSGKFLLGLSSQRHDFFQGKKKEENQTKQSNEGVNEQ